MTVKAHLAGNILEKSMFLRVTFKVLGNSKKVSNSVLRGPNDIPDTTSEPLEPVANPSQAVGLKKALENSKNSLGLAGTGGHQICRWQDAYNAV